DTADGRGKVLGHRPRSGIVAASWRRAARVPSKDLHINPISPGSSGVAKNAAIDTIPPTENNARRQLTRLRIECPGKYRYVQSSSRNIGADQSAAPPRSETRSRHTHPR